MEECAFVSDIFLIVTDETCVGLHVASNRYIAFRNSPVVDEFHKHAVQLSPVVLGRPVQQSLLETYGIVATRAVIRDYRNLPDASGMLVDLWRDRFRLHMEKYDGTSVNFHANTAFEVYSSVARTSWLCAQGKLKKLLFSAQRNVSPNPHVSLFGLEERLLDALWRISPYLPYRFDCLAYASALTRLARAHGFPALLNIGIRPFPFEAHAWCSVGDKVIGDDQNLPFQLFTIYAGESV